MEEKVPNISFMIVELETGSASVGIRLDDSTEIEFFDQYRNIAPGEAVKTVLAMAKGDISAEEIANLPFHIVEMPAQFWQDVNNPSK